MSVLSASMQKFVNQGSMIRRMFDAGLEMKKKYGEDAVFDFSIGNPDLAPPPEVAQELQKLSVKAKEPGSLGYMPNAGFPWALDALAKWLSQQQQCQLERQDVMLSCGAAGGMNAFFHSVLEPGDEVLGIAPYFVEYGAYVANHGGVFKALPCRAHDFGPDIDAIAAAIKPNTRALIINSPNNPTGAVYSQEDIIKIAQVLEQASQKNQRPIYLVSDEPYRFLTYDGAEVPAVLPLYSYAVVISSFSKNLSLAGERVGYVALAPQMKDKQLLMAGLIVSNRCLGFVNPPVVGQYLMVAALHACTDKAKAIYANRKMRMAAILDAAGIKYIMPKGAFYFFPMAPGGDEDALVAKLLEQNILVVPGKGFGYPGHFRLSFAVADSVIDGSAQGFIKACKE